MPIIFNPKKNNVYEQVEQNTQDIADLRNIVDGIDVQSSWISEQEYTTQQAYYDLTKITGAIQDVKVGEHVYFVASEIDAIISWIGNDQYQVTNATSRKGQPGAQGVSGAYYTQVLTLANPVVGNIFTVNNSNQFMSVTPLVGTIFNAVAKTPANKSYILICKVTIYTSTSFTAIIEQALETTGDPGTDGISVDDFVTISHHQEDNETITKIQAVMSSGEPKEFEVHAENGAAGATPSITITNVPSTAAQGYLTEAQFATLNENPNEAYIMFYGEKFIPMDVSNGNGYRVYTHHGETENKQEVSKFIYLNTTLTAGQGYFWVMNVNIQETYRHTVKLTRGDGPYSAYLYVYFYRKSGNEMTPDEIKDFIKSNVNKQFECIGTYTEHSQSVLLQCQYVSSQQFSVYGFQLVDCSPLYATYSDFDTAWIATWISYEKM